MGVGRLSQTETRRGLPRVDFEGREKFRYFGEMGWSQGLGQRDQRAYLKEWRHEIVLSM